MHTLSEAIDGLLELIRGPFNGQQLQQALQQMLQQANYTPPPEIDQALERLAPLVADGPLLPSSLLALSCGALVEHGGDAQIPSVAILQRMQEALARGSVFAFACREEAHKQGDEQAEIKDIEECVETFGQRVAQDLSVEAEAWQALEILLHPTNAVLMRLARERATTLKNSAFIAALEACPLQNHAITCLRTLVRVLEEEELVVLHPALRRGYRVRINGVGDNFQLHTLLADALIGDPDQGWLPGEQPDPRVAEAARSGPFPMRGDNPQDFPLAVGAFNLWNWHGLQADGTLPEGYQNRHDWIWNEGCPADIEPFEGSRVILLGPPPYRRTWKATRYFPALTGALEVVGVLTSTQVEEWLTRIVAARAHQGEL